MSAFPYALADDARPQLGLVALQADETIEDDMRVLLPDSVSLNVSRVPSALDVTSETLAAMAGHLTQAAALFPAQKRFDAVGYGCTSGTAEIGAEQIATLIQQGCHAARVTEPVSALIAACRDAGVTRLAFLSPYIAQVSDRLRAVLAQAGIETPVFGSFEEGEEARVVQIDGPSIFAAGTDLCAGADVDALFLSCTNLRTLPVIPDLQRRLGLPVLSSNLVLGWHLLQHADMLLKGSRPRDLLL